MKSILRIPFAVSAIALITACGGGSGGSAAGGGGGTPASTTATISGVAATGAPMAGATITLTDKLGATKTTSTDASGNYSMDVTGLTAPFAIVSHGVVGDGGATLVSVLPTAPSAGQTATANITPLTHTLAAAVDSTGDPLHLAANVTTEAGNITPTVVATAASNLQTAMAPLLAQVGAPTNFDFIRGTFSANGTGVDRLFDSVQVSVAVGGTANGGTTIAVKDGNGSVNTSTLNLSSAPAPIPAMNTVADYSMLSTLRTALNTCFAVTPSANRATDPACTSLVTSDYLNDGKSASGELSVFLGSQFDNATADKPQVVRFLDASHAQVKLVLVQTNGARHALTSMAENSANTGNTWALRGNQRNYWLSISGRAQKFVELNPTASMQSGYTTGLVFNFDANAGNSATVMANSGSYVKVTGPGLPTAGVILKKSVGTCPYLTVVSASGNTSATRNSCNATFNLAGVAADSINATAFASQFIGPITGGGTPSSWYYANFRDGMLDDATIKTILPFTPYTVTVHSGINNSDTVITEYLRSRPLTVAELPQVRWNTLSPTTAATLTPSSPTVFTGGASMPIAWVPDPLTPPVMSVIAQVRSGGVLVAGQLNVSPFVSSGNVTPATSYPSIATMTTGGPNYDLASINLSARNSQDLVFTTTTNYTTF